MSGYHSRVTPPTFAKILFLMLMIPKTDMERPGGDAPCGDETYRDCLG